MSQLACFFPVTSSLGTPSYDGSTLSFQITPIMSLLCSVPCYFRPQAHRTLASIPIWRPLSLSHSLPLTGIGPDHQPVNTNRHSTAKQTTYPRNGKVLQIPQHWFLPTDSGGKLFFSYNEVDFNMIISFITHLFSVIYCYLGKHLPKIIICNICMNVSSPKLVLTL